MSEPLSLAVIDLQGSIHPYSDPMSFESTLYEQRSSQDSSDSSEYSGSSSIMPIPESPLYCLGGFFPVHLNDLLHNKYRIVHKLGHGDDGTVWLASIEEPTTPPTTPSVDVKSDMQPRYVTVKILRASLSATDKVVPELEIFQHLHDHLPISTEPVPEEASHPGEANVVHLLDTFEIRSANGTHLCLVLPFAGFCLRDVKNLELWKRKAITRQLAMGVAYLHDKGVCHSDLTATNVLLNVDIAQHWTVEQLYKSFGAPQMVPFPSSEPYPLDELLGDEDEVVPVQCESIYVTTRSRPDYTVPAIFVPALPSHLFGMHATIIDLGRAFLFKNKQAIPRLTVPIFYPAPEAVFNLPITPAVDMWFLACLTFQIYTGEILFHGPFYGGFQKNVDEELAIKSVREVMGAVPGDLDGVDVILSDEERGRAVMRSVRCVPKEILLSRIWKAVGEVDNQEARSMWELIGGMLMFNPALRISADDASRHRWFGF